jgi:DNA/RNA endonuclease G (NUC1)
MRSIFKPIRFLIFISGGVIGSFFTYYTFTFSTTNFDVSIQHPSMPYSSHGPESELIHRKSYTLSYNRRLKQANWISECLTKDDEYEHPKRKNFHFKEDKEESSTLSNLIRYL